MVRVVLSGLLSLILLCQCAGDSEGEGGQAEVGLKDLVEGRFRMGVGTDVGRLKSSKDLALLRRHYDSVTTENSLKMSFVQRREGQWRFDWSDELIFGAEKYGIAPVGHCLVWAQNGQTPDWIFKDGFKEASRELVLRRLRHHIHTVMGRYQGKVKEWDVVNEALSDRDDEFLRPTKWTRLVGDDFVAKTFQFAREASPEAMLIYNDYSCEGPGKRSRLVRLIQMVREQGGEIDAVGLQAHYEMGKVPFEDIVATVTALRELGVKVIFSELDLDVMDRSGFLGANVGSRRLSGANPYVKGCPEEVLQQQARDYARLFEIFIDHADVIERVSVWNLHDGQSWLNHWPWKRTNYPLLFDRERKAKPGFYAVKRVLEGD